MLAPFPIWPSRCSFAKCTPCGENHDGFLHPARQSSPFDGLGSRKKGLTLRRLYGKERDTKMREQSGRVQRSLLITFSP